MLIEFSVANFRSFWKPQKISMTATPKKDLRGSNSFESPVRGLPRLLRSTAIYGPNAAGKSNLIIAIGFMRRFVLFSAKEFQEGEEIPVKPFLFNDKGASSPSEFEVHFIQEGVRYQYGFAATDIRVTNEWLIAFPEGRGQRWFERTFDRENNEDKWYFGSRFTGHKKQWREMTRKNALFLSTAVQLNSEQLKPVFTWFQNLLAIGHGMQLDPVFSMRQCVDEMEKRPIVALMNEADLSISDIQTETKVFVMDDLPGDMPPELREKIQNEMDGKKLIHISFLHPVQGTDTVASLPLEEESDGTRKLFAYAAPWLDILNRGRVILVDELDTSLHPKIMRLLISMFHSDKTNKQNGQLFFTTHDTSILDQELMRRDQIWFVEKNEENATHLYPLSDFKPRAGEALQKNYLNGRYGALPYVREVGR